MRQDFFYSTCERCGDQAGRWSRKAQSSGRVLCGRCWQALTFDECGHKQDDMVTPETLERRHTDISTSGG